MARGRIHPLTGRQDWIRSNKGWREKIEYYEAKLGYVICGVHLKGSGTPCLNRPVDGGHRCAKHTSRRGNPQDGLKYHSRTTRGMHMSGFIQCRRCKDMRCEARRVDDDDDCVLEKKIYDDVMALKDKYNLGDFLQVGMLESVAEIFVKKFRCDRMIADEGMVIQEIVGFDRVTGAPLKNTKEHPLLKISSNLNRELIAFADSLEFSPKAQSRKKTDERVSENGREIFSSIMQDALRMRNNHD
jgi:hypothetical protein